MPKPDQGRCSACRYHVSQSPWHDATGIGTQVSGDAGVVHTRRLLFLQGALLCCHQTKRQVRSRHELMEMEIFVCTIEILGRRISGEAPPLQAIQECWASAHVKSPEPANSIESPLTRNRRVICQNSIVFGRKLGMTDIVQVPFQALGGCSANNKIYFSKLCITSIKAIDFLSISTIYTKNLG